MTKIASTPSSQIRIARNYIKVKEAVIKAGFAAEIDWQDEIRFSQTTESDFLREAAWVVLSSGMREAVIRQKFPAISAAFLSWRSARRIVRNKEKCRARALTVFRHRQKIDAIVSIAEQVSVHGFKRIKARVQSEGIRYIQVLPFMGPATAYHLAKNIGLDVAKPDRHLRRVAAAAGYDSPALLCQDISKWVGDRVSVVDLVIWRFATLNTNYAKIFA